MRLMFLSVFLQDILSRWAPLQRPTALPTEFVEGIQAFVDAYGDLLARVGNVSEDAGLEIYERVSPEQVEFVPDLEKTFVKQYRQARNAHLQTMAPLSQALCSFISALPNDRNLRSCALLWLQPSITIICDMHSDHKTALSAYQKALTSTFELLEKQNTDVRTLRLFASKKYQFSSQSNWSLVFLKESVLAYGGEEFCVYWVFFHFMHAVIVLCNDLL